MNELNKLLVLDEETQEEGPFVDMSDIDMVWKLFEEYELFDRYRKLISNFSKLKYKY